jgi:SWI/SNF-related matrix-associated actin-dependent regulator 1 of chromatin subfamily A
VGKTIQAIGIINGAPKIHRVCVICPASLKLNWQRELEKWLVRPMSIGVADGKCFPTTDIVIINYDIVHKYTKSLSYFWDLLICDESHAMKNPKSRRAKHVLGFNGKGEAANLAPIPARRKVFLTGTPILNRPVEVWPLIHALDPVTWNNFFAFAKRYCGAKQIPAGRKMVWDFTGASNMGELQNKLRSTIMIRRLKADVLPDLPQKTRQIIELPADGCEHLVKQEICAFDEAEMDEAYADVELAKASDDPAAYASAVEKLKKGLSASFEAMARLRHETAVAKVPAVVEHLQAIMDERGNGKFLIFAHHLDVITALHRAFPQSVTITGDTPLPQRQANVDKFQKDPNCGPFIGNIKAAGVGLTLTAADMVAFAELDWVPGNVTQAEDRAHRIGQTRNVLVQHLVLAGSLDANIAKTIVRKQAIIDKAMDALVAAEPIRVSRSKETISFTPKELSFQAALLTTEQINAIHLALRMLAGVCNGARDLDGAGFSKFDTRIGKELAARSMLSANQAVLGQRLVIKYRRQIGEDLARQCGWKEKIKA